MPCDSVYSLLAGLVVPVRIADPASHVHTAQGCPLLPPQHEDRGERIAAERLAEQGPQLHGGCEDRDLHREHNGERRDLCDHVGNEPQAVPLVMAAQMVVRQWPLPAEAKFVVILAAVTLLLLASYR